MTLMIKQDERIPAIIIEDDPQLAAIFSEAFQEIGCMPQIIDDGDLALQVLTTITISPALILLDLNLPNVNGDQILQFIRTSDILKDTLVILATANSRSASYIQHLADYVLLKPISYSQLCTLLTRLCPHSNPILAKNG